MLLFCLICVGYRGSAQDIKVATHLDTATILLGDQTKLRLEVAVPVKERVTFPAISDTLSSKIQIVDVGKIDTVRDAQHAEQWQLSRSYTITSFEVGVQTIPSLTFRIAGEDWKTEPLPLAVKAVAIDTTKAIYDIKQPLSVSYGIIDWLRDHFVLVLLIILGILMLVGGIYYLKNKRRKLPEKEEMQPELPPDEMALNRLRELNNKQLWQKDQVKLYYSELTDIIREFIEGRYQIRAMEQTSEEIFTLLRTKEMTEQQRVRLVQMLRLADLVKFAKENPLPADNEQIMEHAVQFVEEAREKNREAVDKLSQKDERA